jgi:dTDP-4-amino-4,6-dideoxygalactose transaminase
MDVTKTTERIRKPFVCAVKQWLKKGQFILDENVEIFESHWARFCGAKHCVGVSNGSDAIYLALLALGVGPGDEVITQGNAYNASVVAILRTGAIPRFADVHEDTTTIDPESVKGVITERTKAILVVHLYGFVCRVDELKVFGFPVVEDCAQAHGTNLQGDIACFSFYPTKTLGAFGDAGAVVTDNPNWYAEIRARRHLGQVAKNDHQYFGSTMRLDPIQAIALNLQLPYLKQDINERMGMVKFYGDSLPFGILQWNLNKRGVLYFPHLYPIFCDNVREVEAKLHAAGIMTSGNYPMPVYKQPFYPLTVVDECPVSERLCATEISLPLFIGLTKKQQQYVIRKLQA